MIKQNLVVDEPAAVLHRVRRVHKLRALRDLLLGSPGKWLVHEKPERQDAEEFAAHGVDSVREAELGRGAQCDRLVAHIHVICLVCESVIHLQNEITAGGVRL